MHLRFEALVRVTIKKGCDAVESSRNLRYLKGQSVDFRFQERVYSIKLFPYSCFNLNVKVNLVPVTA